MEAADDVCRSEGVCEVMCSVESNQLEQEESMETHASSEEAAQFEDFSASAQTPETNTERLKPKYSYRFVFSKALNCIKFSLGLFVEENL